MIITIAKSVVFFPVTIFKGCFHASSGFKRKPPKTLSYKIKGILTYIFLGLPLTIYLFFELVILINGQIVGEPPNYHFSVSQADLQKGLDVVLPGNNRLDNTIIPNANDNKEAFYNYLVEKYSPTFIHKMGHHPLWDIPTDIFFDQNSDPRDNVKNAQKLGQVPVVVYGDVIAETADSYYLSYMLYHIKDYDQPLRQLLTHWTYHDNDNEGLQLRVDKETMEVAHVETWYHNRFFLCNRTGKSSGSEPIQSLALFEDKTHVVIYAQSLGHGVRCATHADLEAVTQNTKILRHEQNPERRRAPKIDRSYENNIGYKLDSLSEWYRLARDASPSGSKSTSFFEDLIPVGETATGEKLYVGRYIAGLDYDRNAWSRPKPPWSWDDKWDKIPIFLWHYFPSYAFSSHAESQLSHHYIYNKPVALTFNIDDPHELLPHLTLEMSRSHSSKWENLTWRSNLVGQKDLWAFLSFKAKQYVNYVFNALG